MRAVRVALLGLVALAAASCTDPMPTFVFPVDGAVDGMKTDAGGSDDATAAHDNSDAGADS